MTNPRKPKVPLQRPPAKQPGKSREKQKTDAKTSPEAKSKHIDGFNPKETPEPNPVKKGFPEVPPRDTTEEWEPPSLEGLQETIHDSPKKRSPAPLKRCSKIPLKKPHETDESDIWDEVHPRHRPVSYTTSPSPRDRTRYRMPSSA